MKYSLNLHDYLNKISKAGGRSIVNLSRFSEAGGGGRCAPRPPSVRPWVRIRVSGDQHEDEEENNDDGGFDQSSSVTKSFAAISEPLFTIY